MKHRLSTRILIPNLVIIIGSLLLLAVTMLLAVRYFVLRETSREFDKVRKTMDLIIQSKEQSSPESTLTQDTVDQTVRYTSVLFADVRALILTDGMQYLPGTADRPFDEAALQALGADDGVATVHAGHSSYLAASILFHTPQGRRNLLLYTSLDSVNTILGRLALMVLAALAGAALIALAASAYVSRRIAGPLGKLSRWAHSIGARRFTRFAEQSGTVEIDFLAESLNGMAQRLEAYDAAQKTFLQNASHELRTPLMSIQGYAEGIKHGVFSDAGAASDVIISESLRLAALVDDLLYLSKLETADGFYAFAPVPLAEVLSQCAEKLDGAALKEGKALTLLPCPEAPVMGDGEKLLRAFLNLAGNGLRYAATQVTVKAEVTGAKATVTVSDDGPGFDPEDLSNLFVRFYKGKNGKYGLGLSIAQSIVEKHGGCIRAENGAAGGAVFTVELPLLK